MPDAQFNPTGLIDRAALDFLKSKKLLPGFSHYDVWMQEHAVAFTVAKMMDADMLAETKVALQDAIANGTDFNAFKKRLKPYLMSKGWWGEQIMVDPLDNEAKVVQLGSTRRLETIFQTNMATAFAAGQWSRIETNKSAMPYLRYNPSAAGEPREAHKRYYGLVLPVEHELWKQIYPPNGYGCLCTVSQLTRRQAERYGITEEPEVPMTDFVNPRTGEVVNVPVDITPSFAHNHADRLQNLSYLFAEKHGQAALTKLNNELSEHMMERLERPNFLENKPLLKVIGGGNIANAQALVYNKAGCGYQLGNIPVGKVGSIEWIEDAGQYFLFKYDAEGTQLFKITHEQLLDLKETDIGYFNNSVFTHSDFKVLKEREAIIRSTDLGNADYADKLAAYMYSTNGGYKAINPILIRAKGNLNKLNATEIQAVRMLDQFFERASKHAGVTARVMDTRKMPNAAAFLKAHESGSLVRYSNFTSTSSEKDAFGGHLDIDVVMAIHGVSGVDISQVSRFTGEKEVLMSRHTVYKVKSHTIDNGVHHIILDEVTENIENHDMIIQLSLDLSHQI